MRRTHLPILCTTLLAVVAACDQRSQGLPFEPDPDHAAQKSIGQDGGLISHPMGISLDFPRGALSRVTKITVLVGRNVDDFPGTPEGVLIPGTYFRVFPAELQLSRSVEVDVSVPLDELDDDARVRLGFATDAPDQSVTTEGITFDLTAGILHGELPRLGAMAAIVVDNAVSVAPDTPPTLGGGTFSDAGTGVSQPTGASARTTATNGAFIVRCSHTGNVRRCFDSGTIELWASAEIQDRLSSGMVVLNPDVDGSLEFTDFVGGVPTRVNGRLAVTGTLRVQLGQAITSFTVDDTFVTNGPGGSSALTVEGSQITLHNTSTGSRTIGYEVRPAGTGEQLIVRAEKTVEFDNEDGTTTTATLFIDLRLRR